MKFIQNLTFLIWIPNPHSQPIVGNLCDRLWNYQSKCNSRLGKILKLYRRLTSGLMQSNLLTWETNSNLKDQRKPVVEFWSYL